MMRTDVLTKAEEEITKANGKPKTATAAKSKKAKDMIKTAREKSGYVFKRKGDDEEHDVPYIDNHMWFRLSVRKNSEQAICDKFMTMKEEDPRWNKILEDTFYPQSPFFSLQKGRVVMKGRPLVAGVVYVKTIMRPEIADYIEGINGIYGFGRNSQMLILPLSEDEGIALEGVKVQWEGRKLNEDMARLKKDEYVSIVEGTHKGKYGILMGAKSGKIEVCIRNEGYKDDWDVFEASELRHLAEPPEKKWKEMTAKEAVESLMAKDPQNAYLKSLKKAGLLKDILYPEGRKFDDTRPSFKSDVAWQNRGGAEGGKRIRSIATEAQIPEKRKFDKWEPKNINQRSDRSNSNDDDRFSESSTSVNSKDIGDDWDFVNSLFDDISSSSKPKPAKTSTKSSSSSSSSSSSDDNDSVAVKSDFNALINNILDDMVKAKSSGKDASSSSSSSSNRVIEEFLKDLDKDNSSKKKGGDTVKKTSTDDDLDFDKLFGDLDEIDSIFTDSDDKAANKKTVNNKSDIKVPSMEDYPTFEAYLDALVSYERTYPNPSARNNRRNEYNSYNNNNNNNNKSPNSKKNNDDNVGVYNIKATTTPTDVKPKKTFTTDVEPKKTITADVKPKKTTTADVKPKKTSSSDNSLESLKLTELKALAKEKGLPVSGKKEDIVARIVAAGV